MSSENFFVVGILGLLYNRHWEYTREKQIEKKHRHRKHRQFHRHHRYSPSKLSYNKRNLYYDIPNVKKEPKVHYQLY